MNKTFIVNGMKCVHCKTNVEGALKAIEGVARAEANLEAHHVTVEYDEAKVNEAAIGAAVNEVGYEFVG